MTNFVYNLLINLYYLNLKKIMKTVIKIIKIRLIENFV